MRFNPESKLHCSHCAYWEALTCRYLYLIPSWEMLGTLGNTQMTLSRCWSSGPSVSLLTSVTNEYHLVSAHKCSSSKHLFDQRGSGRLKDLLTVTHRGKQWMETDNSGQHPFPVGEVERGRGLQFQSLISCVTLDEPPDHTGPYPALVYKTETVKTHALGVLKERKETRTSFGLHPGQ